MDIFFWAFIAGVTLQVLTLWERRSAEKRRSRILAEDAEIRRNVANAAALERRRDTKIVREDAQQKKQASVRTVASSGQVLALPTASSMAASARAAAAVAAAPASAKIQVPKRRSKAMKIASEKAAQFRASVAVASYIDK